MVRLSLSPRRLPIVWWQGREYFVDVCLREFRTKTGPEQPIEFVGFGSPRGQRMRSDLIVAVCPNCGSGVAGPRDRGCVTCPTCGKTVPD